MAKQLGIVPGIVDQLFGVTDRVLLPHRQIFVAHVGPHRLGGPIQQGVVDGLHLGREASQQHGAILTTQFAQDGDHITAGNGLLQHADDAAMEPLQQAPGTLGRE